MNCFQNRKFCIWLPCLVVMASTLGLFCGGTKTVKIADPCEVRFSKAMEFYSKGKFDKSKLEFQKIQPTCSGQKETVKILYYLGLSFYNLKEYDQAEYQFRDIQRDFHSDSLAEHAQYLIGKCQFAMSRTPDRDQAETKTALVEFKKFLEDYPQSVLADSARNYTIICRDKIAKKEFNNGRLYQKMHEHKAAIIYFRDLLSQYGETSWAGWARYELAFSLSKDDKKSEAIAECREILKVQPPDALREKTQKLLDEIQK